MVNTVKYLSPSSINEWNLCQEKFKWKRMENRERVYTPSLPADTGTVFDLHCKSEINRRVKFEIDPNWHPDALKWGGDLFRLYVFSGAYESFIAEGVGLVVADTQKIVNGVPIRGKPDIIMADGTVKDWKTNGVGSRSGAYAKPGYYRRIDCTIGSSFFEKKPPHPKAGQDFELISPQWAKQTCIYSFLMGRKPTDNFKVGIEQVAVHGTKLSICSYEGEMSLQYKMDVWEELKRIWSRLRRGFLEVPVYSKFRCHAFGRVCEAANDCTAFQTHLQELQKSKEDGKI